MMTRLPSERAMRDFALDRNFAFRMGEIALIGLDTGEDKPDHHPANGGFSHFTKFRIAQTAWLKDQFKRPEIANAPYVVAFVHIPLARLSKKKRETPALLEFPVFLTVIRLFFHYITVLPPRWSCRQFLGTIYLT
jgi:hypothetical protein